MAQVRLNVKLAFSETPLIKVDQMAFKPHSLPGSLWTSEIACFPIFSEVINMNRMEVVSGDITKLQVDAIV